MLNPEPSHQPLALSHPLRASIRDGASHAIMLGAGENYLSAFGVFLRGTPLQVGILSSLPPLLAGILQVGGVWATRFISSRRRFIAIGAAIQACIWPVIGLLALLPQLGEQRPLLLIFLACCYHGMSGIITPVWNSLIGDMVPHGTRGRFFGLRSRAAGLYTFIGLLGAGLFLHVAKLADWAAYGFLAVFLIVFLARLYSAYWLTRHADPEFTYSASDQFSFAQFILRSRHSNFARFVYCFSAINFAVFFAAPYYAFYMLDVLHFSYLKFMLVTSPMIFSQFLTLQRWGDLSDRFGNKKLLTVSSFGLCLMPFMWLLSHNTLYLIFVQLYGGTMIAGFNLSSANFLFDAVTPPKRARCVAYQSIVNGIFVFVGTLLGGQVIHWGSFLPALSWLPVPNSPFLGVFFLSGVLRLAAALIFLPRFSEVREVEHTRHRDIIFRVTHIRAFSGVSFGVVDNDEVKKKDER
jgi:MFS family permease